MTKRRSGTRFAVRDGKVVVVGEAKEEESDGDFMQAVNWLKRLHLHLDTKFEPGMRHIYREEDGKLVLNKSLSYDFVGQLTREIDRDKLETENWRLKDGSDHRIVADAVRDGMRRVNVKPELLDTAVAMFIGEHKFAVRDGKVVVIGKAGASDAMRR